MQALKYGFVLGPLLAAAGCASTPAIDPVQQQLGAQEQQLLLLRDEMAELRAVMDGIGAAGLGSSVGALDEELRNLRGEVESLRYELESFKQRSRAAGGPAPRLEDREAPPPTPAVRSRPVAGPADAASNQDDQGAYLDAFAKLKSGDYPSAVSAFEGFLRTHPSSAYAPNAQYWIGEAWYVQRSFDKAWEAFNAVLERFPDSLKAADARLKQGLIRVDQGRMSEARTILQEVASRHAGSSAGRLAAERLQRMGGG